MPGRSWITTSLCPARTPSFFSTVTPGQLPTYCAAPVSELNNVVLPQLGFPASAILICAMSFLLFANALAPHSSSGLIRRGEVQP